MQNTKYMFLFHLALSLSLKGGDLLTGGDAELCIVQDGGGGGGGGRAGEVHPVVTA